MKVVENSLQNTRNCTIFKNSTFGALNYCFRKKFTSLLKMSFNIPLIFNPTAQNQNDKIVMLQLDWLALRLKVKSGTGLWK